MLTRLFLVLLCMMQCILAFAQNETIVKVGMLVNDSPASLLSVSGEPAGIGVDLVKRILNELPLKTSFIHFNDRQQALKSIESNDIQLLVGSFEESLELEPFNIVSSLPYFIDPIVIVSLKKHISMKEVLSLVFNRLFVIVFVGSLVLGLLFTIILFFLEKDKHPHFEGCSTKEKFSYSTYAIFTCFFRDLLYDPVTTLGRVLLTIWMVFSVFAITILAALVTSSVLHLMKHGGQSIYSINDLNNSKVGILLGKPRLNQVLVKSGSTPVLYVNLETLFQALTEKKIDHVAVGKSNYEEYLSLNSSTSSQFVESNVALGFDAWTLYVNKYYGSITLKEPLINIINAAINQYRNDFKLYRICSDYTSHPEYCVF
ncbi:MAG: hypothetical protein CMF41_03880 [Legionellales bacterium]|nr:hypothetical protein [Legionellales bacterium]|tara:strand:- start:651 stop:1766 length:1116 start_codon:yes stop_codon:yes gene_type:complete